MKPKRNLWLVVAAALLLAMPVFAAGEQAVQVTAIFSDDRPINAVEVYQMWAGEPVAIDPAVRSLKGAFNLKFKGDKETGLQLIREALRAQAGISIDRDADGHLKATVVPKPSLNPAKP